MTTEPEYTTWSINKYITMINDDGALTFDLGGTSLSLLPADVPKVMEACSEWLAKHQEPQ